MKQEEKDTILSLILRPESAQMSLTAYGGHGYATSDAFHERDNRTTGKDSGPRLCGV